MACNRALPLSLKLTPVMFSLSAEASWVTAATVPEASTQSPRPEVNVELSPVIKLLLKLASVARDQAPLAAM